MTSINGVSNAAQQTSLLNSSGAGNTEEISNAPDIRSPSEASQAGSNSTAVGEVGSNLLAGSVSEGGGNIGGNVDIRA